MQESEAIALLIDVYFERRGVEPALIPGSGPSKMAGSGTTTTESSREDGTFAKPVYYDWSTDWPRVNPPPILPGSAGIVHRPLAPNRAVRPSVGPPSSPAHHRTRRNETFPLT